MQEKDSIRGTKWNLPRLLLAAPGSGSGKTLLTCGLLKLLLNSGLHPVSFKCGPDYIDPMFHRRVLGIPSRNLDTFFSPDGGTRRILARAAQKENAQIALIEGVMGYFDGTGPSGMEASSFDLALQTQTPVVLIVDAKGMSRSVLPVLKGFAAYEAFAARDPSDFRQEKSAEDRRCIGKDTTLSERQPAWRGIRGVLLNRISAGMFPVMKKWIEQETDLRVIGYLPQEDGISWESRHLGLLQPEEIDGLQQQIARLAERMAETIDLQQLLELARSAPALYVPASEGGQAGSEAAVRHVPRIAVARDEAFRFYYEDNLELLQECGAELVFFSPIHDRDLPEAEGLLLGGGYPELYARALAENVRMRHQIRAGALQGLPILAECGGFMYLQEFLEITGEDPGQDCVRDAHGLPARGARTESPVQTGVSGIPGERGYAQEIPAESVGRDSGQSIREEQDCVQEIPGGGPGQGTVRCRMCGVLPGSCKKMPRLVRFGYLELEGTHDDGVPEKAADPGENRAEDKKMSAAGTGSACTGSASAGSAGTGYLSAGHRIRGHEFHYFDSTENGSACRAVKPGGKRSWDCMAVQGNIMAGFPHLYYRSDPAFAENFVERCRLFAEREKRRAVHEK